MSWLRRTEQSRRRTHGAFHAVGQCAGKRVRSERVNLALSYQKRELPLHFRCDPLRAAAGSDFCCVFSLLLFTAPLRNRNWSEFWFCCPLHSSSYSAAASARFGKARLLLSFSVLELELVNGELIRFDDLSHNSL